MRHAQRAWGEMQRLPPSVFDARSTPASNSTRREMAAMHASDLATRQYQRRGSSRGLAALNAPCREPIPVPLVLQLIKAIFSIHSIAAELNHDVTDTFHVESSFRCLQNKAAPCRANISSTEPPLSNFGMGCSMGISIWNMGVKQNA